MIKVIFTARGVEKELPEPLAKMLIKKGVCKEIKPKKKKVNANNKQK